MKINSIKLANFAINAGSRLCQLDEKDLERYTLLRQSKIYDHEIRAVIDQCEVSVIATHLRLGDFKKKTLNNSWEFQYPYDVEDLRERVLSIVDGLEVIEYYNVRSVVCGLPDMYEDTRRLIDFVFDSYSDFCKLSEDELGNEEYTELREIDFVNGEKLKSAVDGHDFFVSLVPTRNSDNANACALTIDEDVVQSSPEYQWQNADAKTRSDVLAILIRVAQSLYETSNRTKNNYSKRAC